MKLWRKLAMKEGKGTGRKIKHMYAMQEYVFKQGTRTYPLLSMMFANAGLNPKQYEQTQEGANELLADLLSEAAQSEVNNEAV